MAVKAVPRLDEWLKLTDAGKFAPRSKELVNIDLMIKQLETTAVGARRDDALYTLKARLDLYKSKHPGWERQPRNKFGAIGDLNDLLNTTVRPLDNAQASDAIYGRTGFSEEHHRNARLGIVWLFSSAQIIGEDIIPATAPPPAAYSQDDRAWYQKLLSALVEFFQGLKAKIYGVAQQAQDAVSWKAIKSYPMQGLQKLDDMFVKRKEDNRDINSMDLPATVVNLINSAIPQIIKSLKDVYGPIASIVQGSVKSISAALVKVDAWYASLGVQLGAGTPASAVASIEKAMTLSMGDGLLAVIKGSLQLAFPAAASAVGTIATVLEKLYKMVTRHLEVSRLKCFLADVRQIWNERDLPDAFYKRAEAFNTWFKSYANSVPGISMLCLNSGFCGDKMIWLNMMSGSQLPITVGQFSKGCAYLDSHLMPYGTRYLSAWDVQLTSDNAIAKSALAKAKEHGVIKTTDLASRCVNQFVGNEAPALVQRRVPQLTGNPNKVTW